MRKIREILRLRLEKKLSFRLISQSCGISRHAAQTYVKRALKKGLSWPLSQEMDDGALERLLYPLIPQGKENSRREIPEFSYIHNELRRKGVTLMRLWEEYRERIPEGYQYSQFCKHYHDFAGKLKLSMKQVHKAGEKAFVDHAGHTVPITDPKTGVTRPAQIFVGVLGASGFTYAEAQESQDLENWVMGHTRMFEYFQGVPEIVVPDNPKIAVTTPSYYEPDINPTYLHLALHYGVVIIPTRVRKPKDKAKVENAVQLVERWILAALRNRTFFSVEELNREIRKLLEKLNNRPFRIKEGSRRSLFESLDKPALRSLPKTRYQYGYWKKKRIPLDYHIEVEKHFYSVPHALAKKEVEICLSTKTLEVYFKGKRVTSHKRGSKGGITTVFGHMPPNHRVYKNWTPEKILKRAQEIGCKTAEMTRAIFKESRHPLQAIQSCIGILKLGKDYGEERLDAACHRALSIHGYSYTSVRSILKNALDRKTPKPLLCRIIIDHENIRGAEYYKN